MLVIKHVGGNGLSRSGSLVFPSPHTDQQGPLGDQDGPQHKYKYMQSLLQLDSHRPNHPLAGPVRTPLNVAAWERAMEVHPDPVFVDYLVQGIRSGSASIAELAN